MRMGWSTTLVLALLLAVVATAASRRKILVGGALGELVAGNRRYATGKAEHARQGRERRDQIQMAQQPFAVIVGCADSRVPPEVVFDQGLGDLFVVRSAGHVIDDYDLASIEYAVEHLGAALIVVLGHERCGAVRAALENGEHAGHIGALAAAISPAVKVARKLAGPDPLDDAVRANVELAVGELATSEPLLEERVAAGKLRVIGARYDLDTGEIEFFADTAARAPAAGG